MQAYFQEDFCALPTIPETGKVQMPNGCRSADMRAPGQQRILDSILERECAMRDLLLDLQQEDCLVDAALQELGKRVAAFKLNYSASAVPSNKLAISHGSRVSSMIVCVGCAHSC
jgi:hypothetical protein